MPRWVSVSRRNERTIRGALAVLACLLGLVWFVLAVKAQYPVGEWLFWTLAKVWVVAGIFGVACAAGGRLVLGLVGVPTMPWREKAVLGFATGMLTFFLLVFVGGVLGLFGPALAVLVPGALTVGGLAHRRGRLRRTWLHLRAWRARPRTPAPWWTLPAVALGVLGLLFAYIPLISPRNIAFDSHFYHLGIAQQYFVEGGILPSREAWTPAALPHLASILYTWAFLFPGLSETERLLAAAHVEWVVFVFTLASIPVLVRWLVPGAGRWSWVVLFLFPGIFTYDSNLSTAADHINAAWAIPVFIALRRAVRSWSPRDSALLSAMLAGAALTKYQAMYILAFPVLAYAGLGGWRLVTSFRTEGARGARKTARTLGLALAAALVTGLVLTAPHWLKNWAFYGDPLFPYLHRYLQHDGIPPGYGPLFDDWGNWQLKKWKPTGTTSDRIGQTLKALVYFSVEPNNWPSFHGKVPVFGSLFTLCTVPLLFLRGSKRTWSLAAATYLGIAIWYWTMHQDRYLQTLLPWMVAVVAAALALAWRSPPAVRVAFGAMVGLQVVWGGDAPFLSHHVMSGGPPSQVAYRVLGGATKKKLRKRRLDIESGLFDVAAKKLIPEGATVLIHENNPRLGLWRRVVADIAGWQFGIRYDLYRSPKQLHDHLRELGVDYFLARPRKSRGFDSIAADLVFHDYAAHHATSVEKIAGWKLYQMADDAPDEPYGKVLYLGCSELYQRGLHDLSAFDVREVQVRVRPPKARAKVVLAKGPADGYKALLPQAQFVVSSSKCGVKVAKKNLKGFDLVASRKSHRLWSRR